MSMHFSVLLYYFFLLFFVFVSMCAFVHFSFASFIVFDCLSNIVSSVIGFFVFCLHCFVVVVVVIVVCFLIEFTVFKHSAIQMLRHVRLCFQCISAPPLSALVIVNSPTLSLLLHFRFLFN